MSNRPYQLGWVQNLEFKGWPLGWRYVLTALPDMRVTLHVEFERKDINTGELGWGKGRAWEITEDMDEASVVKTAFAATKAILEHEGHEGFEYKGVRLFDPHFDLERMMEANRKKETVNA